MLMEQAAIKFVYQYIYLDKPDFTKLSEIQIQTIQHNCKPVFPGEEFPESFPEEDGYTGLYLRLYRGFYFSSEEERDSFLEQVKDGNFTCEQLQSWSQSKEVAMNFAKGAGHLPFEQIDGCGVILKIEEFIDLSKTLFCSFEAHKIFRSEFEHNQDEWEDSTEYSHWVNKETFFDEAEIVLLPGTYNVSIDNIVPEKDMRTLKLDHNNSVDTILEPQTLNDLFEGLTPKSTYVTSSHE